jgi:hypothetical protein
VRLFVCLCLSEKERATTRHDANVISANTPLSTQPGHHPQGDSSRCRLSACLSVCQDSFSK